MPAVTVYWYDGGLLPRRPEGLPDGAELGEGRNGIIFHGTKGILMCGNYGGKYRLLPESAFSDMPKPAEQLRRAGMSHEMDWVRACKEPSNNRTLPLSNFEYSGPLNEMVVMGNLAVRMKSLNKKLSWDGANMQITNLSDSDVITVTNGIPKQDPKQITLNAKEAATEYIQHTYREGWSL
jgi:hypothetical protein